MNRRGSVRFGDDSGASAVVVVISLFMLFAAALVAIDAGQLYGTRRGTITATDAAALAEARALAITQIGTIGHLPPTSCDGVYSNVLSENGGGFSGSACSPNIATSGNPFVTVTGQRPADLTFAPIFGFSDPDIPARSSATWFRPAAAHGLRPIALCQNNSHVVEWLAWVGSGVPLPTDPLTGHPEPDVHRVYFSRQANDVPCGADDPGNWGWMDYDGGNNSSSVLTDWLLNGYPGWVAIGDCDDNTSNGSDGCDGDTGAGGGTASSCPTNPTNVAAALTCLVENETLFAIAIYDTVDCSSSGGGGGGGSNCEYNITGFINVVLRGFNITGAEADRYFDFEFKADVIQGRCCNNSAVDTGVRAITLCAIDHDDYAGGDAARCARS